MSTSPTGIHLLARLEGCQNTEYVESLKPLMFEAAKISHLEVVGSVFHQFKPAGVTAVLLLAQSHLSLHSWPEEKKVLLDLFTCGDPLQAQQALNFITKELKASSCQIQEIER